MSPKEVGLSHEELQEIELRRLFLAIGGRVNFALSEVLTTFPYSKDVFYSALAVLVDRERESAPYGAVLISRQTGFWRQKESLLVHHPQGKIREAEPVYQDTKRNRGLKGFDVQWGESTIHYPILPYLRRGSGIQSLYSQIMGQEGFSQVISWEFIEKVYRGKINPYSLDQRIDILEFVDRALENSAQASQA